MFRGVAKKIAAKFESDWMRRQNRRNNNFHVSLGESELFEVDSERSLEWKKGGPSWLIKSLKNNIIQS